MLSGWQLQQKHSFLSVFDISVVQFIVLLIGYLLCQNWFTGDKLISQTLMQIISLFLNDGGVFNDQQATHLKLSHENLLKNVNWFSI